MYTQLITLEFLPNSVNSMKQDSTFKRQLLLFKLSLYSWTLNNCEMGKEGKAARITNQ